MKPVLRKKIGRAEEEQWWVSGGALRLLLGFLRQSPARLGALVFDTTPNTTFTAVTGSLTQGGAGSGLHLT